MRTSRVLERAAAASLISLGMGFAFLPTAFADEDPSAPQDPAVQVDAVPMSDSTQPAAVVACGNFAQALDGASTYYGEFSDSFEGSDYNDPAVQSSNEVGRTALRQAAGVAMDAANTPDLDPAMGDPMRAWSADATKLLLKMALRIPGDSLNTTATEMNNDATNAQQACAAAGTHA
ncbi:MAG: hypothetical protein QOH82_2040 [Mycobacterium sp.]|nr:hypothetical protein [Mycobacterium sp.]